MQMIGRQDASSRDKLVLRAGYRPKRLRSKQLFVLQGLPKVGPTTAKRLLERFKSVKNAINAPIEELQQVEGIGVVAAKAIRDALDREMI
jgi:Fanconi anemia group M protein